MRTTLNIEEDVLQAARELAALKKITVGKALSELARQALRPAEEMPLVRNGFPLLAKRLDERPVDMDTIKRLLAYG